jgi:hypothetical protein
VITNSTFRDNGVSGIDLKTVIQTKADLSVNQMNKNIQISDSEFINNQNHVVFTTLDLAGLLSKSNASQWSVQHVYIKDSLFEKTADYGGGGRAFLVKDSHSIYWDNIKLLGGAEELRTVSAYDLGLNHTLVGTNVSKGPARTTTSTETETDVGSGSSASDPDDDRNDAGIAINTGGNAYSDFDADTFHFGGKTYNTGASIAGTSEDEVYQTERYGNFRYSLPVENGLHEVTLKFAEIYFDRAGARVFDVRAEDDLIIDNLDIYKAAGGKNVAHDKTFQVEITDGWLDLDFISLVNNAKLSGIEIDFL